jgi:ankyrin repeat protein
VISTLLKAGANVKAKDATTDFNVLLIAAEYNTSPEVISRLIKAGADVNAKDKDGYTPLIEAASKNQNPDVVAALLKAGANAKAKNNKGYSAFEYAKYNRSLEGTEALKKLEEASQ